MYVYNDYDQQLVDDRVEQFREQTRRYLAGDLEEAEFLPLRLQNGLYIQRHAPMLRIAIPYGMLASNQLRKLADIADEYDRGYGHFSTRQNIQLNWPELERVPDILAELAKVEMHAIQTSGNCIRNTSTDQFAGVLADEVVDPRPYCELIRQWSTFHPEFAFLPRKFKIAVNSAASTDRAATRVHDIGVQIIRNDAGELGYRVYAGGGLGRTPVIGEVVSEFVEEKHLLTYIEAIVRVYNQHGRRDNKFKARIKILVRAMGIEKFRAKVEAEWAHLKDNDSTLTGAEIERMKAHFSEPNYEDLPATDPAVEQLKADSKGFRNWLERNATEHRVPGYTAITLSLKKTGVAPGDITSKQMRAAADLADRYSVGEARVSHFQNLILADVRVSDLPALWEEAKANGFATPNIGTLTDIICCPGGDFCSLANAKSIPIAEQIQRQFDDLDYVYDLGNLELNISGCMNACGHHHVGNIGILGVDKKGAEFYQISLGGDSGLDASLGKILGPSFNAEEVPSVIEKIIDVYVKERTEEEEFIDTVRRVGIKPFKEQVYA
ncbi:MAG: nitrite/sulfite reductase [Natronospirillum sp.]|uniref:nitrite/sulfite reductase n=1 Tax=Natronospirillum sp. TaxID=2812955 RepID=UPI0025F3DD71|nr:nitrite/sulfite reductase [Natronospirillum sp.]MCH8552148.1 nitrite/sulfite reductase [Natronospirillum sp.]